MSAVGLGAIDSATAPRSFGRTAVRSGSVTRVTVVADAERASRIMR